MAPTDKCPAKHLRSMFAFSCFASLVATLIFSYRFSHVDRMEYKFSLNVVTRNDSFNSQDTNQTQVQIPVNANYQSKIGQPQANGAITSSSNACSLNWNREGLDIQSYERVSGVPEKTQTEQKLDMKPLLPNPKIVLNPDKYLLPALIWGPNNQLVGLRETVFTAIMLNRTFVIPRFEKHGYDQQRNAAPFIAPVHRVDLESLCNFVTCITIDQFREGCNGLVQAILKTKILNLKEVRKIEETIQLRILPPDVNDTSLLSNVFVPPKTTSERARNVFQADEIKTYFTTQAKCMVLPFPFLHLHGKKYGGHTNLHGMITEDEMRDKNATEDVQLMISVMRNTQHPKYLRTMSRLFQRHVMGDGPFVSVHWRYDVGDYLSKWNCAHSDFMKRLCTAARNFTNEDFAKRIEDKLKSLEAVNIIVKHVYIASPRSEINRIKAVAKILQEKQGVKTFTSLDLDAFMQHYKGCGFLKDHSEDIISTLEMEVCSIGISFIGSDGSWSGNVRNARLFSDDPLLEKSRHDIFDI